MYEEGRIGGFLDLNSHLRGHLMYVRFCFLMWLGSKVDCIYVTREVDGGRISSF